MPNPNRMCEVCQESPATVHLTEMANQHIVTEKHLCDVCAAKQGLIGKIQVQQVTELLGMLGARGKGGAKEADFKCPDCGITYGEFRAKARFGCAKDYDVFRKHVVGLLEKIHGATEHKGKRPPGAAPAPAGPIDRELENAERELEKLIGAEQFEKAAKVRDRIRELKSRKDASK